MTIHEASSGGEPVAAAFGLSEVLAAADAAAPRVCRWPPCDQPPASLDEREPRAGNDGDDGRAARGGRRPQYCSDAHQRRATTAVRRLRALRDQAAAIRDTSGGRERRRAEVALADLDHRLALHGEARPSDGQLGPAAPVLVSVAEPAETTARHLQAAAGPDATVLPFPDRRRSGRPPLPAGPEPVLGLRRSTDRPLFDQAWDRLRDASDAARAVVMQLRRTRDDLARRRLAADTATELVELSEAADQIVLDLVRIRPHITQSAPDEAVHRLGT